MIASAAAVLLALLCFTTFFDFSSLRVAEYSIKFRADEGGMIVGPADQTVKRGGSIEQVMAVAKEGYKFLKWEDTGRSVPTRTVDDVNLDKTYKANFVKVSDVKYKILMIYVTEVKASLSLFDGTPVQVDVKFDERDIEICHEATRRFDSYLNGLFDGRVTFEIFEYFTKDVITEDNIQVTSKPYNKKNIHSLYAENIPEVADILSDFGSYIVMFSMGDSDGALDYAAGWSKYKSACVHYEDFAGYNLIREESKQKAYEQAMRDEGEMPWRNRIELITHEFIHTVDEGIPGEYKYKFHNTIYNYPYGVDSYALYLLNEAFVDGTRVGIPFDFWLGKEYNTKPSVTPPVIDYDKDHFEIYY